MFTCLKAAAVGYAGKCWGTTGPKESGKQREHTAVHVQRQINSKSHLNSLEKQHETSSPCSAWASKVPILASLDACPPGHIDEILSTNHIVHKADRHSRAIRHLQRIEKKACSRSKPGALTSLFDACACCGDETSKGLPRG
jgi:hypothetical protein